MMHQIVLSGTGGQGLILAGIILAEAAIASICATRPGTTAVVTVARKASTERGRWRMVRCTYSVLGTVS